MNKNKVIKKKNAPISLRQLNKNSKINFKLGYNAGYLNGVETGKREAKLEFSSSLLDPRNWPLWYKRRIVRYMDRLEKKGKLPIDKVNDNQL